MNRCHYLLEPVIIIPLYPDEACLPARNGITQNSVVLLVHLNLAIKLENSQTDVGPNMVSVRIFLAKLRLFHFLTVK